MAVPVGITALELNNNVIRKASTKHYLQNILLSYTKAVFITESPHRCYLQWQRSNAITIIVRKGIKTISTEKQNPLPNGSKNRSEEMITTHTPNTCCQRLMRIIYMSGWFSQGWGRSHSVENCVTLWFTGSHNRSFLSHRRSVIHSTCTHKHKWCKAHKNTFWKKKKLRFHLLYMVSFHGTHLLMTTNSLVFLRENRFRLNFWQSGDPNGASRSSLHHSVRKAKGKDAGATSRALPRGDRLPLKAWQGKKKASSLCGSEESTLQVHLQSGLVCLFPYKPFLFIPSHTHWFFFF